MKLEFLLEDGQTLIAFADEPNADKSISVWTRRDGHTIATRKYLRSLQKPETMEQRKQAYRDLRDYCNNYQIAFKD